MTLFDEAPQKTADGKRITALVIEALGAIGIGVYFLLGPRDLGWLDVAMLFVIVTFVAFGTTRTIIGGLMTAVAVYLATGLAASFYPVLTPYARSFLNVLPSAVSSGPPAGTVDSPALALSFAVMTVVFWAVLELLFHASVENTHMRLLGPMDRVGGAVIYLAIGVLVAALLFNTLGYGTAGPSAHERASLRPEFNRVLELHYLAQSFWFSGRPPGIYAYDLDLL